MAEDAGRTTGMSGAKFLENIALTDKDGSESITGIRIDAIPAGWVLK